MAERFTQALSGVGFRTAAAVAAAAAVDVANVFALVTAAAVVLTAAVSCCDSARFVQRQRSLSTP